MLATPLAAALMLGLLFGTVGSSTTSQPGKCQQVDPHRCLFRQSNREGATGPEYVTCAAERLAALAESRGPLFLIWVTGPARAGKDLLCKNLAAELSGTSPSDWATHFAESDMAEPCTVGIDYAFVSTDRGTYVIMSVEGTDAGDTSQHVLHKYAVMSHSGLVIHVTSSGAPNYVDLSSIAGLVTVREETRSADAPSVTHKLLIVANRFDKKFSVGGQAATGPEWLNNLLSDQPSDQQALRHSKTAVRSGFSQNAIGTLPPKDRPEWQASVKLLAQQVRELAFDNGTPKQWTEVQLPLVLQTLTELAKDRDLDDALSSECSTSLPRIRTSLLRAFSAARQVLEPWATGSSETSELAGRLDQWIIEQMASWSAEHAKSGRCAERPLAELRGKLDAVKSELLATNEQRRSIVATRAESRHRDCGQVLAYRTKYCAQKFLGKCINRKHRCANDIVTCVDARTIQTRANQEQVISDWVEQRRFTTRTGEYAC